MKRLIVFLVVVGVLAYGGNQVYGYYTNQVDQPFASGNHPVPFTVRTGEGTTEIGDDLRAKGLIGSTDVFRIFVKLSGAASGFQAGDYTLNTTMTMRQIVAALQHSVAEQVSVTIPEGYTAAKASLRVEASGIGSAADYLAAEKGGTWTQDFLASRPAGADLEGYLFPDTYQLNKGATVHDLVASQVQRFGEVFTPQWRAAIRSATPARPAESIENVVILASIVEREANNAVDRPKVCSVYYNRLQAGMPLQADATLFYAEGVFSKQLLQEDLKFQSPYNTYLNPGLPPGPISNPGSAALAACVNPPVTNYVFYFTDAQGVTHFYSLDAYNAGQFCGDQRRYGVSGGGGASC